MILTAISLVALVPMVGLAIDSCICYAVRMKLSAACDAAALAAARSFNSGQTLASQVTNTTTLANGFYSANYQQGFLGSTLNVPPAVDIPTNASGNVMTVTVSGSATVHPYFLRMLGYNNVTVNGSGKAARRDVNIALVLDRSGSLNTGSECAQMVAAATTFPSNFAEGRDSMGLVTFSSGMYKAFPTDGTALSTTFKSGGTNIAGAIGTINCGGATSTPMAYLKAANDLVAYNRPGALNVIVLFTDGLANALTLDVPLRTQPDTRYGNAGGFTGCTSTTSTCSMPKSTCTAASGTQVPPNLPTLRGVFTNASGGSLVQKGVTYGLLSQTATSTTDTDNWISGAGCQFGGNSTNGQQIRQDMAYIPDQDIYGNCTRLTATGTCAGYTAPYWPNTGWNGNLTYTNTPPYASPQSSAGLDTFTTGPYSGYLRSDEPANIARAAGNALDYAALQVRTNAAYTPYNIVTFVIGLGVASNSEPPDPTLMKRVANDPASPIFLHSVLRPDGMYIPATDDALLAQAFQTIASQVLRLAK